MLVCVGAAIVVAAYLVFSGEKPVAGDFESLTLETYKKNLQAKLREALLEKRSQLVQLVGVLSREEFIEAIWSGVEEGMVEELSEAVCDLAREDLELRQMVVDIAGGVYEEFFRDKK